MLSANTLAVFRKILLQFSEDKLGKIYRNHNDLGGYTSLKENVSKKYVGCKIVWCLYTKNMNTCGESAVSIIQIVMIFLSLPVLMSGLQFPN